jgi:hypothetical protein
MSNMDKSKEQLLIMDSKMENIIKVDKQDI